MNHLKASLAAAGVIALAVSTLAGAQGTDTGPTPGPEGTDTDPAHGRWQYGRWDDNAISRPRSLIPQTSYGYVGVNVGQSIYDLNCVEGPGCDETPVGGKLYTGGKFNRMFGVELAYIHLGDAAANGGTTTAQLADLSLVGNLPLGARFNVYGKIGGLYSWTDIDATTPGVPSGEENDFGVSYGFGVQFDVNRDWAFAADWDNYRIDYVDHRDDVQLVSVGLVYKF